MRQKLKDPVYMTAEELGETYEGKWVFITNAKYTSDMEFLGGIPVIIANDMCEWERDDFCDEFKVEKYAPRTKQDYTGPLDWIDNAMRAIKELKEGRHS
jgi:hypothetical protein